MQPLTNILNLNIEDYKKLFDGIEVIVTDCDGVLWVDNEPIPGSAEMINEFRNQGKKIIFLTNNSTKHREHFLIKLNRLGFIAEKQDIVSSASIVVSFLKRKGFNKKVYLIGSTGLARELKDAGINHLEIGPDVIIHNNLYKTVDTFHADPEVGAVVVGFDEHFSYVKLLKAASYLNKQSCIFLATNKDERFPISSKIVVPGTGAIVKSIETVSQKAAILLGKPSSYVVKTLVDDYGVQPMRCLIIGDNCKTDILMGSRSGLKTLLVLSGLTKLPEVEAWKNSSNRDDSEFVPDYYVAKLGDLVKFVKKVA